MYFPCQKYTTSIQVDNYNVVFSSCLSLALISLLCYRYGGRHLLGTGVLCTAVFTLLTPVVAEWNVYLLIVTRIIEGLGEVSFLIFLN